MAEFQKLREGGYGTTFSNNYLEQGRYAEAVPRPARRPVSSIARRRRALRRGHEPSTPRPPRCGDADDLRALARATAGARDAGRSRSRRRPRSRRRHGGPRPAVPERQGRVHRRDRERRASPALRCRVAPLGVRRRRLRQRRARRPLRARRAAARCCCSRRRRRVRGRRRRRRGLPAPTGCRVRRRSSTSITTAISISCSPAAPVAGAAGGR